MAELVSIADAKTWLNITDDNCDAILAIVVPNASDAVIEYLGYNPQSSTETEFYNGTGTDSIAVNRVPITEVDEVKVSGLVVPYERIIFGRAVIYRTDGVPFMRGRKNVEVTYTAGYQSLPGGIVQGVLLTVAAMYNSRTIDPNITGESVVGVYSAGFWPTGPGTIPPAARDLLSSYRTVWKVS